MQFFILATWGQKNSTASYSNFSQINAESQQITTLPLETNFMVQLDNLLPHLTSVFQKKGGVSLILNQKYFKTSHNNIKHYAIASARYLSDDMHSLCGEQSVQTVHGCEVTHNFTTTVIIW